MKEIKNVLICGLGGVGCVIASALKDSDKCTLKILADKQRYERYINTPARFNGKVYSFEYILPEDTTYSADLIIIATKNDGLESAISNIKNFVYNETIIISVLNGIHSERIIAEKYNRNIPISFYIGDSCIRNGRSVEQNGNYKFFIGDKDNKETKQLKLLSSFFDNNQIKYRVSKHINERYWKKFMVNTGLNQLCALHNITFKELKQKPELVEELKKLITEVKLIAEAEGIENSQKLCDDTIKFLIEDFEDATPSMLQDIRAGRKTEVDIFSGEIIKLGEKHNIKTPSNAEIYKRIKELEANFQD